MDATSVTDSHLSLECRRLIVEVIDHLIRIGLAKPKNFRIVGPLATPGGMVCRSFLGKDEEEAKLIDLCDACGHFYDQSIQVEAIIRTDGPDGAMAATVMIFKGWARPAAEGKAYDYEQSHLNTVASFCEVSDPANPAWNDYPTLADAVNRTVLWVTSSMKLPSRISELHRPEAAARNLRELAAAIAKGADNVQNGLPIQYASTAPFFLRLSPTWTGRGILWTRCPNTELTYHCIDAQNLKHSKTVVLKGTFDAHVLLTMMCDDDDLGFDPQKVGLPEINVGAFEVVKGHYFFGREDVRPTDRQDTITTPATDWILALDRLHADRGITGVMAQEIKREIDEVLNNMR